MSHQKFEQMKATNNIRQGGGQASHFSKGVSIMSGLQEDYESYVFLRQEAEGYWVYKS